MPGPLVLPRRLRPGDRVAAVTLSWGGPGDIPHRYEVGKRQLQQAFGVEVVEMPHTLTPDAVLAADPDARAADLMQAFADPSIAGIVSTIGGDDSIRLLPHLDPEVIRDNPKVFLGYSDTTVTHLVCHAAGLATFYGPSIMSGFAENGGPPPYLVEGVRAMLFSDGPPGTWPELREGWMVEQLDWSDETTQQRLRRRNPSTGRRWLQGSGVVEGPLLAGCLEVLQWLRGTPVWPDPRGRVLAVETSEEAPPPSAVTSFLRSLAASGELRGLAALLLARPGGASLPISTHEAYDQAVLRAVRDEAALDIPVVTNLDFGHTDPMWTLPIGAVTRIDADSQVIDFPYAVTRA